MLKLKKGKTNLISKTKEQITIIKNQKTQKLLNLYKLVQKGASDYDRVLHGVQRKRASENAPSQISQASLLGLPRSDKVTPIQGFGQTVKLAGSYIESQQVT